MRFQNLAGREAEFTALWMDPRKTADQVASSIGTARAYVFRFAEELGLPSRVELRRQAGLCPTGPTSQDMRRVAGHLANRREENELAQLARLEAALAAEAGPHPVERQYCFVCGGPCPTNLIGHPSCTGRRAA